MIWDPHLNEDHVIINIDDQILSTPIYAKNIYDKIHRYTNLIPQPLSTINIDDKLKFSIWNPFYK